MEVTKENVETALAEIEQLIKDSLFVSIDEEMTGITSPEFKFSVTDTPAERYRKMAGVAQKFKMIQFGVCLWNPSPEDETVIVARPYNFYCFPEEPEFGSMDIVLDAGGVAFLKRNHMNWNRWFNEGIPYLTAGAEEKLKEKLFGEKTKKEQKKIELVKEQDKEFVAKAMAVVDVWMTPESEAPAAVPGGAEEGSVVSVVSVVSPPKQKEHALPDSNAFLRRALCEAIGEKYPSVVIDSRPTQVPWKFNAFLLNLTEQEKLAREQQIEAEKHLKFKTKSGLRRLYKILAEAQRPLVGHNLNYDLLFLLSHFQVNPLPKEFSDTKKLLMALSPMVFDTKYIAVRETAFRRFAPKETHLEGLHKTALGNPVSGQTLQIHPDFARYGETASCHEAGYDAFITGVCFANLYGPGVRRGTLSAESPLVNRLYVMTSTWTMRLDAEDEPVYDGPIVKATFDKTLQTSDLEAVIGEVQKEWSGVETPEIKWINGDSALLCWSKPLNFASDSLSSSAPASSASSAKVAEGDADASMAPANAVVEQQVSEAAGGLTAATAAAACPRSVEELCSGLARQSAALRANLKLTWAPFDPVPLRAVALSASASATAPGADPAPASVAPASVAPSSVQTQPTAVAEGGATTVKAVVTTEDSTEEPSSKKRKQES